MNVENEKCVIVVDENLPFGIIANTAAIWTYVTFRKN